MGNLCDNVKTQTAKAETLIQNVKNKKTELAKIT